MLDEAKQRAFARKYDLKRQAVELEKYEDALPGKVQQRGSNGVLLNAAPPTSSCMHALQCWCCDVTSALAD